MNQKTRRIDRLAEWAIRIGGILVIISVIWILVMIARVAAPLFFPAHADLSSSCRIPASLKGASILASGGDDSRQRLFLLDASGLYHIIDTRGGNEVETLKVPEIPSGATTIRSVEKLGKSTHNLLWDNGAITSVTLALDASTATLTAEDGLSFYSHGPVARSFVRKIEKGAVRVDQLADGRFSAQYRLTESDLLGNQASKTVNSAINDRLPGTVTAAILDQKGHYLYAGTDNGWVARWDLSEPGSPRLLETVAAHGRTGYHRTQPGIGGYIPGRW